MKIRALFPALSLAVLACSAPAADEDTDTGAFQGTVSNLARMEFETEVHAADGTLADELIEPQLYWLVGPFHQLGGDPRLTWAETKKLSSGTEGGGGTVAKFSVRMSVAWPKNKPMPQTYEIILPRNVDMGSQSRFYDRYKDACFTPDHDVDFGNAWYDFDPSREGCHLDSADIIKVTARVEKAADNTVNTYPEYDRIWKDGKLEVVAVFGRDEPGSTNADDLGAREYRKYVDRLKSDTALTGANATEQTFDDNGHEGLETTIEASAGAGAARKLLAHVFLLSKPSWSGDEFTARYNRGTKEADFVAFAGHAGLGGNIQKLQSIGTFVPGQYQLFAYDGCDTFAYIDKTLSEKKKAANGAAADPQGTRDLDLLLNAMPAPWTTGDPSILRVTRALLHDEHPTKFEDILRMFPTASAPVVVGDEDNVYAPH